MKWLIISDDSAFEGSVRELPCVCGSDDEFTVSGSDLKNIGTDIKILDDTDLCVIHAEAAGQFPEEKKEGLCAVAGYLAARRVTVISDVRFAAENVLPCGTIVYTDKDVPTGEYINGKYNEIKETARRRAARRSLMDMGIPFTADCFAFYIEKNKPLIIGKFMEAGMDINSRDDSGTPLLNIACRNDNFELVPKFLDMGADINAVSEDRGYTAVMDAVWRGNEKITEYLIKKGAELNTVNKEGQTNLVLAVGADRDRICSLLVRSGADPDVKDQMGMSAWDYASLFKKEKILSILKPYHKE